MDPKEIAIQEKYIWIADELENLTAAIEEAFINRPVPSGPPRGPEEMETLVNPLEGAVALLVERIEALNEDVLTLDGVTQEAAELAVWNLEEPINDAIVVLRSVWERPFPPEFEGSEALYAAFPEKMLRRCLDLFKRFIRLVRLNPAEWKEQECTKVFLSFELELEDDFARLQRWFDEKVHVAKLRTSATRKQQDSDLFWAIVAGALLCKWLL